MIGQKSHYLLPQLQSPGTAVGHNILYMPDFAAAPHELLHDEDTPSGDCLSTALVLDDRDNVIIFQRAQLLKLLFEVFIRYGIANTQLQQELYEAFAFIRYL